MKQAVLVVALESVPDVAGLRRLHDIPEALSDYEVGEYALQRQRANRAGDELPPMLRRAVCLSAALLDGGRAEFMTLRSPDCGEADMLRRFFSRCEAAPGGLVVWGRERLIPVLNARALAHGVPAPSYWRSQLGGAIPPLDLAPLLGADAGRAALDQCDRLGGGSGCLGADASGICEAWLASDFDRIARACSSAAQATAGVYLRLCLGSGELDRDNYEVLVRKLHEAVAHAGCSPVDASLRGEN